MPKRNALPSRGAATEGRPYMFGESMSDAWGDLRFAVRVLLKRPVFTVVALLTLALGIGANAAIFGVVDAVLFKPLPFGHPERLLQIWGRKPQHRGAHDSAMAAHS